MAPFPSLDQHADRESRFSTLRRIQIFVLFNGQDETASALRTAAGFVEGLGGDILIAAPLVVPYPLPLERPAVDRSALLRQIKRSISEAAIACQIHRVLIAYARDKHDGWRTLLPPHCIVVVGMPNKFCLLRRFRAWRAARFLAKQGHEVMMA